MKDIAQVYLEIYKGRHGQSDAEYQAGRSDAGKRISGDDKTGPNYYTKGRSRGATPDAPTAPGAKPVNTPKLSASEKEYHQYNKSGAKSRAEYSKVGGSKGLPGSVNAGFEPEDEMVEAWYSGKGTYRTTVSGHKVRWDEDDATDDRVNAMLNKKRQEKAAQAGRERLKAKGKVPTKDGKPVFESVVEYLYVEGYADTIESAEAMAECISEEWVNTILEKDETEIGITGKPIPKKKRGPKSQYEFEKNRRKHLGPNVGGTPIPSYQSGSAVNPMKRLG